MLQSFQKLSAEPGSPLRKQPANGLDVMSWLQQAELKLKDARMQAVSPATRMDAAYDAVLFCCLAVACAEGYRAGSEKGHHVVVLEGAAQAVGLTEHQFDELDTLREWRNRKYRGGFKVEPSEVDEGVAIAAPFLEKVADWFANKHTTLLKRAAGQAGS
ncbi:hypothetical protein LP416_20030 [Polaromonas sp. P2-4]|nr:hypothetical protein LP416_20030 [Polaromonas sp. P2-4]